MAHRLVLRIVLRMRINVSPCGWKIRAIIVIAIRRINMIKQMFRIFRMNRNNQKIKSIK